MPCSVQGMRRNSDSRALVGFSEVVAVERNLVGEGGLGQVFYDRGEQPAS